MASVSKAAGRQASASGSKGPSAGTQKATTALASSVASNSQVIERRLDVPVLIDWGATPQPGLSDIPSIELVSLVRTEADPAPLRAVLDAFDLGDGVAAVEQTDASGYRLTLRRADGELVEL